MKKLLSAPLSSRKLVEYLLLFLLLASVLSAAAYGGYWYGYNLKMSKLVEATPSVLDKGLIEAPISDLEKARPDKNSSLETPTLDETAGWKTYSNSDFGFEFKYPPKYTLEVTDRCNWPSGTDIAWCREVTDDLSLKFSYDPYWDGLDLIFYENPSNLSIRQWLDKKIAEDRVKFPDGYLGSPVPVPESSKVTLERVVGLENETYVFKKGSERWPFRVERIVKAGRRIITFDWWQNANFEPVESDELRYRSDKIYNTFSFTD